MQTQAADLTADDGRDITRTSLGPPSSTAPTGVIAHGLEGIVATETHMSHIDGDAGILILRGYSVEDLARFASFEQACALLLANEEPSQRSADRWRRGLAAARVAAFERLGSVRGALALPDPMDALRASIARQSERSEPGRTELELISGVAVFAAAWRRIHAGLEPIAPNPESGHAEDFLAMQLGGEVSAARAAALDAYFVTVIDHGMNASTFAARVVASTQSDPVSAITAALGALKGPAHGGAPGPVLEMLLALEDERAAEDWIEAALARGERIMGMGHRVYRTRDPRAAVLETQLERLSSLSVDAPMLTRARMVEGVARRVLHRRKPGRKLEANVEFYTAVLLHTLALPKAMFTPTFAAARVAGWLAHIAEQRASGRLLRPRAHYVGPPLRRLAR